MRYVFPLRTAYVLIGFLLRISVRLFSIKLELQEMRLTIRLNSSVHLVSLLQGQITKRVWKKKTEKARKNYF